MAREIPMVFKGSKTYATAENARKAVNAKYPSEELRYFVFQTDDGRFAPVFLGEAAVQAGVHFNFHVVA
jgi:hypothetical protein